MTTPGAFTVGSVLTAGDMNELGAWTTYTPTIANVATSIVAGRYYTFQDIGFLYVSFVISAAPTGAVSFSPPSGFTPAAPNEFQTISANGVFYDTSAGNKYIASCRYPGPNFRPVWLDPVGTSYRWQDLTNTLYPVLPASGDSFTVTWIGWIS
jgi:hypothetical protein